MAHIRDPKAVSPYTADEALARLVAGNDRFIKGESRFPTVQKDVLAALAKEQHPRRLGRTREG